MTRRVVEVLTFEGCPNAGAALELASRVVRESGADADVRRVDVPDAEAATALRFLGSPTIRVDGADIEPGASERSDYVLACRLYRSDAGIAGRPEEGWLRDALAVSG